MANFDFIKIKQIIISQGHNKLVEKEPKRLNDFLKKKNKSISHQNTQLYSQIGSASK